MGRGRRYKGNGAVSYSAERMTFFSAASAGKCLNIPVAAAAAAAAGVVAVPPVSPTSSSPGAGTRTPRHRERTGSITLLGLWHSNISRHDEVYLFSVSNGGHAKGTHAWRGGSWKRLGGKRGA